MKKLLFLFLLIPAISTSAKPLTFVTYHATSQYYPEISAANIAAIVPYGGKLKLKVEPEADSTLAKKKLRASSFLSDGDVQFGGTEETKGSLELKNVSGTAKTLEAVDAYVDTLYLYNIQFPKTNSKMEWRKLTVNTINSTLYTATFLAMPGPGQEAAPTCRVINQGSCSKHLNTCPAETFIDDKNWVFDPSSDTFLAQWAAKAAASSQTHFYDLKMNLDIDPDFALMPPSASTADIYKYSANDSGCGFCSTLPTTMSDICDRTATYDGQQFMGTNRVLFKNCSTSGSLLGDSGYIYTPSDCSSNKEAFINCAPNSHLKTSFNTGVEYAYSHFSANDCRDILQLADGNYSSCHFFVQDTKTLSCHSATTFGAAYRKIEVSLNRTKKAECYPYYSYYEIMCE